MRGRTHEWSDAEQALREWTTMQRAAFALRQRIERQRWEREVLAPAQEEVVHAITEGSKPVVNLPAGLIG